MQPPAHNRNYYLHEPSGIWCADITGHLSFNLGNAVKCVFRAGKKDEEVDCLRKAAWYLRRQASVKRNMHHVEAVSELCRRVRDSDEDNFPMSRILSLVIHGYVSGTILMSSDSIEAYADGIEDTVKGVSERTYLDQPEKDRLRECWRYGHEKTLGIHKT
jgi:hypothetical protein